MHASRTSHDLAVRPLSGVLVRWLLAGALGGAGVALLCMGWVALVSGTAAGLGPTTGFALRLGAGLGAAVALPTGVVWALLAHPGAVRTARRAVALSAATLVVVASLALLEGAGLFTWAVAVGVALAVHRWAPLLGVCRTV